MGKNSKGEPISRSRRSESRSESIGTTCLDLRKPLGDQFGQVTAGIIAAARHTTMPDQGRGRTARCQAAPAQIPGVRDYRTGLLPQVVTRRRWLG